MPDRNLLFGILAVQMDFISPDQLVAGMNAWVIDKRRPLGEHLVNCGALADDTLPLLAALVDKHVAQHGGSVEQSIAHSMSACRPGVLPEQLRSIDDPDLQRSLIHVPSGNTDAGDDFATIAMPAAKPTAGGRYQVLRPHAAGGLGQVSVARDDELNREVALKELLDRHADDKNSRARFLQEAEITGGLEHPGVVPIYGLGQYADGRPFYAMRFIRGESLRQEIDRFHAGADAHWSRPADQLQLRRLLARLIDVCNAIEYAHSRGVLHRDLKPSNVMLGRYGETLVVDWGLAKALGQVDAAPEPFVGVAEAALQPQSGTGSAPTQMGAAVGTPAFMSPEQAAGRLDQLSPASDVYSLGATLYMLLTGRPPQTANDLGEVLQLVERGKFPPPREVNPAVPRVLEAICLKAMAREPEGRYPSALSLASDLEAWLADEPAALVSEPWTTRMRRWGKRHRVLLTSAGAAAAAVIVSLAAGVVLLDQARNNALTARNAAIDAEAATELERKRAEQLLVMARDSLTHFEKLSKSEQLLSFGMESLRRDLLETSVAYYAALAALSGESNQALADRAHANFRLGSTYEQMGHVSQAGDAYLKALEIYDRLMAADPDNDDHLEKFAFLQSSLGSLLVYNYRVAESGQHIPAARQAFERLVDRRPRDARFRRGLANVLLLDAERIRQGGQLDETENVLRDALQVLDAAKQAHAKQEETEPADLQELKFLESRALMALGALQSGAQWKFDDALPHLERAESLLADIYNEDPAMGNAGFALAQVKRNIGFLYSQQNLFDEARQRYSQGVEVLQQVETRYPNVPNYRREMAEQLNILGSLNAASHVDELRKQGLTQMQSAIEIANEILSYGPQNTGVRLNLARYEAWFGDYYARQGDQALSKQHYARSLAELGKVAEDGGKTIDQLFGLGDVRYSIANSLINLGEFERALPILEQAEATFDELVARSPRLAHAHRTLGLIYAAKSQCYFDADRLVDSIRQYDLVAQKARELSEMPDSESMQATFNVVASGARLGRTGELLAARNGELAALIGRRGPAFAAREAQELADYTGEAADHYLAASILMSATAAAQPENQDDRIDPEAFHAAAVDRLRKAWQGGFLRRKARLTDLLTGAPSLESVRESPEFGPLLPRADFAALAAEIEGPAPAP